MVLSMISGTPASPAIRASAWMSVTTPPGLARDSAKIALHFGCRAAWRTVSNSSTSTKSQCQSNFLKVRPNWVIEPPYRRFEATNRSPGPISANKARIWAERSEEHTSELQSLMRISYAVFCLKKKKQKKKQDNNTTTRRQTLATDNQIHN